ncbi:MAG: hypothetical protein WDO16_20435 [Bacteroidota bacterium]
MREKQKKQDCGKGDKTERISMLTVSPAMALSFTIRSETKKV